MSFAKLLTQSIVHGFGSRKSTLPDSLEGKSESIPHLLLSFLQYEKSLWRRQLERNGTADVLVSEAHNTTHAPPIVINHGLNVPVPLNISR